jgi:hypothetical protein
MVGSPRRRTPEQDSDYDGEWKEALRHQLAEFVANYFVAVQGSIDSAARFSGKMRWSAKCSDKLAAAINMQMKCASCSG